MARLSLGDVLALSAYTNTKCTSVSVEAVEDADLRVLEEENRPGCGRHLIGNRSSEGMVLFFGGRSPLRQVVETVTTTFSKRYRSAIDLVSVGQSLEELNEHKQNQKLCTDRQRGEGVLFYDLFD